MSVGDRLRSQAMPSSPGSAQFCEPQPNRETTVAIGFS